MPDRETSMNYSKKFIVEPGAKLRLGKVDPAYSGKHESHDAAADEIAKDVARMDRLQYLLYADASRSLLIVLQGLDAAGKDGVIRHLFTGMNPQGTFVAAFKQPTRRSWRTTSSGACIGARRAKAKSSSSTGRTTRMSWRCACTSWCHASIWSKRYDLINGFERMLGETERGS